MQNLTLRQREVLDVIGRHITKKGRPPTVREIGNDLGIRSPNGVTCHLKALAAKGAIEWTTGVSRGLALAVPG